MSTSTGVSHLFSLSTIRYYAHPFHKKWEIAIDLSQNIVTLILREQKETTPQILRHCFFSDSALRMFLLLLTSPHGCSKESLFAALHSPLEELIQEKCSRTFFERADTYAREIQNMSPGREREQYILPLRRAIQAMKTMLPSLHLACFSLRREGSYRLISLD